MCFKNMFNTSQILLDAAVLRNRYLTRPAWQDASFAQSY
jgi:hypothetical protein